jgi:hypothetical protein
MADYYQLKNQNIFNPPANTSLGNTSNQFGNAFVQNDLILGNVTVTGATIITPKVSTIGYPGDDTAADPAGGQTITLTGSGFLVGASVLINGSAVGVVSVVSSTTITFTSPANSAGSYVLYVINTDGGTAIAIPGIQYSGVPTWTTAAGSLGNVYETASFNQTVTATGDAPITYSLFSGSIPPGATFNSNGTITGTSELLSSPTTYTFTVRATDAELQDTNRSFSLTITPDVVTWVSPANGTTYTSATNSAISNVVLSATSAVGSGITYTANALPTGLSLTGANISGTPTVEANSSSLLTATANTTSELSSITINWVISVANDVYFEYNTLLIPGASTTFVDDASTNNFAVTINGDTKPNSFNPYTPGYYSNYFDGTGDYLTVPNNTSLGMGSENFTVEFWVYQTSLVSYRQILDVVDGNSVGRLILWVDSAGTLYNLGQNGNARNTTAAGAITTNTWIHVALVRSSGTTKFYINGTQSGSNYTDSTNYTCTTGSVYIGINSDGSTYPYLGYLSNFRMVKGTAVYTSAFTPPTTPLTAISGTQLLTCQSNRFIDNSTNNFAITVNGNTSISSFDPFVPNSSYSTYGSGYFDGSSSNLSIPDNAAFEMGSGDYTVEFWFFSQSNSDGGLIFKGYYYTDGSWAQGFGVRRISATVFRFYFNTTGSTSTEKFYDYTSTTLLNTWYHVAMTVSSGVGYAFLNGTLLNPGGFASVGAITNSSIGLTIGAFPFESGYRYFNGYITDVRVVKGTAVYTTTFTPPSAPLTAIANTSLLTLQNNQSVNNNVFLDNSTNNFFVTRNGNTTQGTFSPYGGNWSNYFDGTGDYLTTPSSASISNFSGDFTIEGWVYLLSTSQFGVLVGGNGSAGWYIEYGYQRGFGAYDGSSFLNGNSSAVTNQWVNFAVSRSGSTVRFFINGALTASQTSANFNYTQALGIGAYSSGSSFITGYLSNIRINNTTALYTSAFTPSTTPLTPITNTQLLTCADNRLVDDSINNFTLTKNGDVSVQRFSPFNPSIVTPTSYSGYFDGTGDYLLLATSPATNITTGSFTIECWVYATTTLTADMYVFGTTNSVGGRLVGRIASSTTVTIQDSTGTTTFTVSTISLNTWNHIVWVRSGSSTTVFVNGIRSSTGVVVNTNSYTEILRIGAHLTNYYTGYISNFRIVVGTAVYDPTQSTITVPTSPLTAISGTSLLTLQSPTFIDNSTNNFTITAVGNSQPTQQNPFGVTSALTNGYTVSTIGGSGYFDGTGDYLTIPTNAAFNFGTGNFTIEAWVYPAQLTTDWFIISASGTNGLFFGYAPSTGGYGWGRAGVAWDYQPATSKTLNAWQHVAISRSGTSMKIFVDGVQQGTTQTNSTAYNLGITSTTIGSQGSNYVMTGNIADVRVVNGTALYTSNFVPSAAPLLAVQNTVLLNNMTSAGIYDAAMMNNMETVGDAKLSTAVSKFGGSSMSFDGTGDYLKAPYNPAYSLPGDFTVETWIYLTSAAGTGNQTIASFGYNNSTGTGPWGFYLNGTGPYTLYFNSTSGNKASSTTVAIPINTWTHVTYCRTGSTGRFFVNGTIVGTTISDSFTYSGTTQSLFVGIMSDVSSAPLYGYLDDLRITKGYARYTSNFTPATSAFPIF